MIIYTLIAWLFRLINIYSWILIIYALMSWVPALQNSFVGNIIRRISEPYLNLFRSLPLQFGGLDLTVLVALIALQVIQQFISLVLQWIL